MSGYSPYLCISASAGSGKTFQLSRRVLRLLAMGAEPDSIAAYTFSRKAAGEIFESIVTALREAASSDENAAVTAQIMGLPRSRGEFAGDLRRWLRSLHRLRVGTLDSRISQMLSAVSVELGLPPEFSLLDTQSSEYLRLQERVLNSMFQTGTLRPELRDGFLQLFLQATHGKSEKNLIPLIERFLENHRAVFLTFPQADAWQGPALADPPLPLETSHREALLTDLRPMISEEVDGKPAALLTELAERCAAFDRSSTWSSDLPQDKLSLALLAGEGPVLTYNRKEVILEGVIWEKLSRLLDHVHATAVEQVHEETLALYGFLRLYHQAYQGEALNGGSLAFEDACMLMANFDQLEPLELAYRLDGEISHWLLDEFQDTNRLQWKVLEPFISEVLQDPEAARSYFYVGDVKQAIYGWRGGDSELFGQVLQEWPVIRHESMAVSYRSAPPVLDLVNRIFSDLPYETGLSAEAVDRWNGEFEAHRAAKTDLPGHAAVWQMTDKEADPDPVLLEMLRGIPEQAETAILVRTNTEGKRIANVLRSEGFRVSQEGAAPLRDDTAVEAVLAAFRQAAHPADAYSRKFLKLTGLTCNPMHLLETVMSAGFTAGVRELIEKLPLRPDADFSRARLERLVQLSVEFDRFGDRAVDRFLAYVDHARPREAEARGVIRIMTIHQSKGLGFDAVIVPVGTRSSFCTVKHDELVTPPADAADPVVTLLPPKAVCSRIPEFADLRERLEAGKTYESFCGLYVALTRAKQSLQILLPAPPKKEGSMGSIENWLAKRIGGEGGGREMAGAHELLCLGEAQWNPDRKSRTELEPEVPALTVSSGRKTLSRLEPSRESSQRQQVDRLFQPVSRDGRDLGSRVHALMEQVDWAGGLNAETFLQDHQEDPDSEAAAHVRHLLALPEMQKPDGVVGLWREQRFESVLAEGWVTGIFDRVVLFEDRAWIQDFKTNQQVTDHTVEHYTPQMQLYRKVLADMLGFAEEKIRCQLLFSKTGELREV